MDLTPQAGAWLHTPTLIVVSVMAMACAAAIMSLIGLTQRVYRGYWWWVAAMWLAPVGASLLAAHSAWYGAVVPGVLLVLSWPVLVCAGLRRFYVRGKQFASHSTDAFVFAACFFAWLVCWTGALPESVRALAYAGAALVLHLYVAWFLVRLADVRRSAALKLLLVVMLLQAVAPMLRMAWLFNAAEPVSAGPLLASGVVLPLMLSMLFTVFLCFVLTHERTVADLRETQRQLRVLADIDMLTQVPNRRRFEELTARVIGKPGSQAKAVLMLFDIDHFKRINDTFGHASGDEALRIVARTTRETLRTRDVLGRIGGDEFMLLLPGASVDDALQIAERITRRLDAQRKTTKLPLSLSFGVVKFESGETIEGAQKRADQALYEAKRQGRKRAVPAELQGRNTVFGESRPLGLDTP
jgi:diguanylate cyclase (GGDEF)-like protein